MQESWKRFRDEEAGCCCVVQARYPFLFQKSMFFFHPLIVIALNYSDRVAFVF